MSQIEPKVSYHRLAAVLIIGISSGLPLALTGAALQAWLTIEGIDMAKIGFFSLVGLPYTFKFLWAPLMDRFEPPFLGRRKSWLLITQVLLAGALFLISTVSPKDNTEIFALVAVLVAFLSASQDIIIDAYRTDLLLAPERGLGSSLGVFGYRLAMIISGGITFVWADSVNGNGWTWAHIYTIMAWMMLALGALTLVFLPSLKVKDDVLKSNAKNDVVGFISVVLAVIVGYQFTTKAATPFFAKIFTSIFEAPPEGGTNNLTKWIDLSALFAGLAFTIPLVWWASQKAKFESLNTSLKNYFSMKGAGQILAFIVLYKLGDAFAGSLITPFLLKGVGFAQAEIGVVNKVIGLWLTIIGAILGGTLMVRLGLFKSLFVFGALQMISNLGFWLVAVLGKGAWGSFGLPAFDLLFVSLKEATNVDYLLLFAIGTENITGGMGTTAFVALLMSLCNQKFTATQYALLSAFAAIGRVWVGPLCGVLSETIGWPTFFLVSTVMAIPGLYMLNRMKTEILTLETPIVSGTLDD